MSKEQLFSLKNQLKVLALVRSKGLPGGWMHAFLLPSKVWPVIRIQRSNHADSGQQTGPYEIPALTSFSSLWTWASQWLTSQSSWNVLTSFIQEPLLSSCPTRQSLSSFPISLLSHLFYSTGPIPHTVSSLSMITPCVIASLHLYIDSNYIQILSLRSSPEFPIDSSLNLLPIAIWVIGHITSAYQNQNLISSKHLFSQVFIMVNMNFMRALEFSFITATIHKITYGLLTTYKICLQKQSEICPLLNIPLIKVFSGKEFPTACAKPYFLIITFVKRKHENFRRSFVKSCPVWLWLVVLKGHSYNLPPTPPRFSSYY